MKYKNHFSILFIEGVIFMKFSISIVVAGLLIAGQAWSASFDTGTISKVYTNSVGDIAIQLSNGFPQANSQFSCSSGVNGWAGIIGGTAAASTIKATLLQAKATSATVQIVSYGCASNGAWINISEVYYQ